MPSDLATSRRGDRREGGGGWAARVLDLVVGGLKVGEEGGIGVEGEVGVGGGGAEGDEEAGSGGGLKDGGVGWGGGGLGGACRWYGVGSSAGSKSKVRAEVEAEGFRARNTCLGLQVVQRARFRWRYEKA
jgi:hypothetical protein